MIFHPVHRRCATPPFPFSLLLISKTMPGANMPSLFGSLTMWNNFTTYTVSTASAAHQPLPSPVVQVVLESYDSRDWQSSSDALTDWLNARWAKSGYQVSKEVVCFTLRANGRDAKMGLGDHLEGRFER